LIVFFGSDALIDDVGGGAGLGNAVAHERLIYEGE